MTLLPSIFELLFYFFYFLVLFSFFFFIPGINILSKIKSLNSFEKIAIAPLLGISLWSLILYLLGLLNIRNAIYLYVIFNIYIFLSRFKVIWRIILIGVREIISRKALILLLIFGTPVVISSMFFSGLQRNEKVFFYAVNSVDGTYHISLTQKISQNIPPHEPGMSGTTISNYHFFSDLIASEFTRAFQIPQVNLYFQFMPIVTAIVGGVVYYRAGKSIFKKDTAAIVLCFLFYFSGPLGYFIHFLYTGQIRFDVNSLDNSVLIFTNPPRLFAQLIYMALLILLVSWIKTRERIIGILIALMIGSLVGFKVYVGIFASFGLLLLSIYSFAKKDLKMFSILMVSAAISAVVFFPINKSAGGLVYVPFSWPKHFFAQGTMSNLQWHLKEQVFVEHNNLPRLYLLYIQMSLYFVLITLGTRVIGIIYLFKNKLDKNLFIYVVPPTLIFTLLPLFTLQKTGTYENFNFISVSGIGYSILTAGLASFLLEHKRLSKKIKYIFVLLFVFLTIPRQIAEAYNFVNLVDKNYGESLLVSDIKFFQHINEIILPSDVLLVDPDDKLNSSSPYHGMYIEGQLYFSGDVILRAHGLDTSERKLAVQNMFSDSLLERDELQKLGINYFLLKKGRMGKLEYKGLDIYLENDNWMLLK